MTSARVDLDLLLHPVRIRIVNAMAGEAVRTTGELLARLADVPQATVYRHVGRLAEAGVLEVVEERAVRGSVQRSYRLVRSRAGIGPADAARMTIDDHRHAFTAATAALLADFGAYLAADPDPLADGVGYRQLPLWLSEEEHAQLVRGLQRLLAPLARQPPTAGRRVYLLSPILFPLAGADDEALERPPG